MSLNQLKKFKKTYQREQHKGAAKEEKDVRCIITIIKKLAFAFGLSVIIRISIMSSFVSTIIKKIVAESLSFNS